MKKMIFLMAMAIGMAFGVKAQTVGDQKLSEIKSPYIELREVGKFLSNKRWVKLDYGQKINQEEEAYIKDDKGKELEFNSVLDCVNQMKNYGYELFQVYVIVGEYGSYKYYVLKRTAN